MKKTFYCLLITIFIVFIALKFFIGFRKIIGTSMSPLHNNDQIWIINKVAYKFNQPQRGDIICYQTDPSKSEFISRIVGLPNETILVDVDNVHINGVKLEEPYANWERHQQKQPTTYILSNNEYLTLNDTRNGLNVIVTVDKITGKFAVKLK